MPMLEKARASLPEPTKGPSKSASKPAAGKAQADSSSTASAGGAAASSTSSAPTDGNATSRKPKSGTKPPAETKASGNKPDSDPSSPQEQMKEEMKGVKFSVYDMKFFETCFGPLWLSCVSHVAPKKDVLNLGLPSPLGLSTSSPSSKTCFFPLRNFRVKDQRKADDHVSSVRLLSLCFRF